MIGIVTDSTCDIPSELAQQHSITVVPQVLIWGDEQYRDRVDLQPGEFYQRLGADKVRPRTSLPGVYDFHAAYEQAATSGARELLVITVSSTLSGTYDNARQAAEAFSLPVTVLDSRGTSMGMGWQVLAAARARDAGLDLRAVLERVEAVRQRITQMVGLDTLEYLRKGGRIGAAARWATSLMRIKSLVGFNVLTNLVEPLGLARTYHALIDLLYRKFFDQLKSKHNLRIAVLHGNALDEAQQLAERIRSEFDPLELLVNSTGPVVGLHTGPGALGLCGYVDG